MVKRLIAVGRRPPGGGWLEIESATRLNAKERAELAKFWVTLEPVDMTEAQCDTWFLEHFILRKVI